MEETSEENKCTLCLLQQEPSGTGGAGWEHPNSAPARAGAAQLGPAAPPSAASGFFPSGLLCLLGST